MTLYAKVEEKIEVVENKKFSTSFKLKINIIEFLLANEIIQNQ